MPRPKPSVSRARRDEWEVHRRELSRLFIVDGVPVAQIAKYMKEEHGFDKNRRIMSTVSRSGISAAISMNRS